MTPTVTTVASAVRVDGHEIRVPVICEPVGDHLAVAPALVHNAGTITPAGGFVVVHRPTGRRVGWVGICHTCALQLARGIAALNTVDWATHQIGEQPGPEVWQLIAEAEMCDADDCIPGARS